MEVDGPNDMKQKMLVQVVYEDVLFLSFMSICTWEGRETIAFQNFFLYLLIYTTVKSNKLQISSRFQAFDNGDSLV